MQVFPERGCTRRMIHSLASIKLLLALLLRFSTCSTAWQVLSCLRNRKAGTLWAWIWCWMLNAKSYHRRFLCFICTCQSTLINHIVSKAYPCTTSIQNHTMTIITDKCPFFVHTPGPNRFWAKHIPINGSGHHNCDIVNTICVLWSRVAYSAFPYDNWACRYPLTRPSQDHNIHQWWPYYQHRQYWRHPHTPSENLRPDLKFGNCLMKVVPTRTCNRPPSFRLRTILPFRLTVVPRTGPSKQHCDQHGGSIPCQIIIFYLFSFRR